jgi:hypothetical protein
MIEKYLWIAGSSIFLGLGSLHLLYTFFTNKFSSRNKEMVEAMKISYPNLTNKTTMWKAWIGFNASHSTGAMFIGLVNIILAIEDFSILTNSLSLLLLNIIFVLFYLFLGWKYWFNIPFTGVLITSICFLIVFIRVITA